MAKFLKFFSLIFIITLIISCSSSDNFRVGTISGPETQLMEVAQKIAKEKYNLNIKIIEFTDYVQPNAALNDGSLDANMFQHQPYLEKQIQDKHYKLTAVGKTFVYPMGVYSAKIKSLNNLPQNALIAIPNDPSNEGRALLLLQKAGIIQLKPFTGLYATPVDIEKNPKQIKFKELDAAQIARSLPDVDAGVINTNYAIPAGYMPTRDAIFIEGSDSPYANIIVVRTDEMNDPRVQQLVNALQSEAVLQAAKDIFKGQAIPAWNTQSRGN